MPCSGLARVAIFSVRQRCSDQRHFSVDIAVSCDDMYLRVRIVAELGLHSYLRSLALFYSPVKARQLIVSKSICAFCLKSSQNLEFPPTFSGFVGFCSSNATIAVY